MPVKPKRRAKSKIADPLGEGAFTYFGPGDFFEGADYAAATTEEQRREHWAQYKHLYIERYLSERRPGVEHPSWGEYLERRGEL